MEVGRIILSQTDQKNISIGPNGFPFSSWKLYHNPCYFLHPCSLSPQHHQSHSCTTPHNLLPADFELMEYEDVVSEIEHARLQADELKAKLEFERRMRRKAESLNEVLAMELAEERRRRESAEEAYRRLQEEVESKRAEAEQALEEIEEERRMLRVAELWREERVQMKLAEAKVVMEEKLQEIGELNALQKVPQREEESSNKCNKSSSTGQASPTSQNSQQSPRVQNRREAENPHIRRGIKGFVEFPRAIRVQSREERVDLETNLECQRAQLRVLMRHRNPASMGLMGTSENLVM